MKSFFGFITFLSVRKAGAEAISVIIINKEVWRPTTT